MCFQATDNNTASLTDKFSYLPPVKAKLPLPKQNVLTPIAKAYSTVTVTPTKLQPSISARKSFLFSPNNSLPEVSMSKACSSPTKPQASLPVESSYYHEVDSDFLDFDTWSPDVPISMLTPISPPDHDIQMTHSRTSMPPQSSSSYIRQPSSTVKTTAISIPSIKTDSNNNNKQFTKQTNTKVTEAPKLLKIDPCSFFTAGSTK